MIDNNWLSSLKKFDRERFNSLQHLSVEKRKKIAAIYFFNLELANIAWNVNEPELRYLKLRWWEEFVKSINTESFFKPNEYLSILSNLVSEKVLSKNDLLRLINAREFDCSNKPFDWGHKVRKAFDLELHLNKIEKSPRGLFFKCLFVCLYRI